jgi:hypothetical protein
MRHMSRNVAFSLSVLAPAVASAASAWPGKTDPCGLLAAGDFAAIGLQAGRTQRGNDVAGGTVCTWDAVLGGGGFLTVHLQTVDQYDKREQRARDKVAVAGLGEAAFVVKTAAGHAINVKAAQRSFRIDGNARLDRGKLESLAKAVLSRM